MSDTVIVAAACAAIVSSAVAAIGAAVVLKKTGPSPSTPAGPSSPGPSAPSGGSPAPAPSSLTAFTPGQLVTITSADGKALGYKLNEDKADNMCDIAFPGSGQFMLTPSSGSSKAYSIKANCDGDGKWMSYLADNATDMIQPKRNTAAAKATWKIACASASQGCTIQATKSKKYVAPSPTGATLASAPAYWIVA